MRPSEVIREARSVLLERDWTQRAYESLDGVCLLGAMNIAATGNPLLDSSEVASSCAAKEILAEVLGFPDRQKTGWLACWNDEPRRSFADVIDLLDSGELVAKEREATP